MAETSQLRIPGNVVFEVLDGEAVLLNLDDGSYFSLNESATRIWQLIEKYGDASLVCDAMVSEFAAERDVVERDLGNLLTELTSRGLVERSGG